MQWKLNTLSASLAILIIAYWGWEIHYGFLLLASSFSLFWAIKTKYLLPLFVVLAGCYASFYNSQYHHSLVTDEELNQPIWVQATVADIPTISLAGKKFPIKVNCAGAEISSCQPNHLAYLMVSWVDAPALQAGDHLQLALKIRSIHSFPNSKFNAEQWAKQARLSGRAKVVKNAENKILNSSWTLNRMRGYLMQRVNGFLSMDNPTNLLFPALIVGARADLTDQQWHVMNLSGTTHLFAISGMHVTFFASMVYAIGIYFVRRLTKITLHWPAQHIMAVIAYGVALFYGFLAGMSVPTLRTLVMLGVLLAGKLMRRHIPGLTLYLTTLLGVLLVDPFAGLSVGFWLSFLAVGLLIWIDQQGAASVAKWIKDLRTQWWISLGMIPITLYYFQVIPLMAFFANLIAIPVVGSIVVPLALIGTLFIFINDALAQFIFNLASWVLDKSWDYLCWITQLPFTSFEHIILPASSLFLIIAGTGLLLLPRAVYALPIAILCLTLPFLTEREMLAEGTAKVMVIGEDQTVLVKTRHKTLLMKNGELTASIEQALYSKGVAKIDWWVAPHYFSSGNISKLTKDSQLIQPNGLSALVKPCIGTLVMDEGVQLEFRQLSANKNADASCALLLKTKSESILMLANSIQHGYAELSDLQPDYLVVHAKALHSKLINQVNKHIYISSKIPKHLKLPMVAAPIDWINAKDTEITLN